MRLGRPLTVDHTLEVGLKGVNTTTIDDLGKVYVVFGRRDILSLSPDDVPAGVFVQKNGIPLLRRYRVGALGTVDFPATIYIGRKKDDRAGGLGVNDVAVGARRYIGSPGDADGDGRLDLFLGAPTADPLAVQDAGEIYLIYGGS